MERQNGKLASVRTKDHRTYIFSYDCTYLVPSSTLHGTISNRSLRRLGIGTMSAQGGEDSGAIRVEDLSPPRPADENYRSFARRRTSLEDLDAEGGTLVDDALALGALNQSDAPQAGDGDEEGSNGDGGTTPGREGGLRSSATTAEIPPAENCKINSNSDRESAKRDYDSSEDRHYRSEGSSARSSRRRANRLRSSSSLASSRRRRALLDRSDTFDLMASGTGAAAWEGHPSFYSDSAHSSDGDSSGGADGFVARSRNRPRDDELPLVEDAYAPSMPERCRSQSKRKAQPQSRQQRRQRLARAVAILAALAALSGGAAYLVLAYGAFGGDADVEGRGQERGEPSLPQKLLRGLANVWDARNAALERARQRGAAYRDGVLGEE